MQPRLGAAFFLLAQGIPNHASCPHASPHCRLPAIMSVGADGLHLLAVLQPFDDPYIPRTYPHLLKWKFPHMNSVDFKLDAKPSKHADLGACWHCVCAMCTQQLVGTVQQHWPLLHLCSACHVGQRFWILPCKTGVFSLWCSPFCRADHAPVLQLNSGFRRKHGSSDVNHQSLGGECCTTNECPVTRDHMADVGMYECSY
jgi:hypothetical protein